MKSYSYPSVLTIAGFDGSGGAGIQADIKTFSALGCYATSVLTALPVQNTTGVKSIYPIPAEAVAEQIRTVLEDIPAGAIKIGMVHSSELVDIIAHELSSYKSTPIVFDPVMVASSGHKLIKDETIQSIVSKLFPLSTIITPNLDEASVLSGKTISSVDDMYSAGEAIMKLGPGSVLLKGGHLKSDKLTSLYFTPDGTIVEYHFDRYDTNNTHGSGCTLSSAIAAYIARGYSNRDAVAAGQDYVQQAILHGSDVLTGKGNGPLNHFFNPHKMIKHALVG